MEAFLERRPDFAVVPLAEAWPGARPPGLAPLPGPYLLLTPASHATDGFFAAVLQRRQVAA